MRNQSIPDDHSSKMKTFLILGIFLAIFLISTIILAVFYGIEKTKSLKNGELCLTPYCVKAANLLLESIDENVEPCENFFEFTCGTWLRKHRVPDDAGFQDTFNILRTQLDNDIVDILTLPLSNDTINIQSIINARRLYDSCVNETAIELDGVDELLTFVNRQFGGWPILHGLAWNSLAFNLSHLIYKLREYGHNIIYTSATAPDEHNSSVHFIRVGQSDLALEQRLNYIGETKINIAYRKFIRDFALALANDTTMVEKDMEDIYNFEKNISLFHWTPAELRIRSNLTIRTTINDLPKLFNPNFNFIQYLRRIYALSNITLYSNDTVSISELDFLQKASVLISQTPPRILQNYFVWRFMMSRVANMPRRYRAIREPFDQAIRGTNTERPRSITCGYFVNNNMGFAVSKIYLKQHYDETARNQSLEMINNIRSAFIEMLKSSTWMDEISKAKAIDKALAIDEKIGYPDYLGSSNTTELDRMYREYIFNESYMKNILKLSKIKSIETLEMLRELVDRNSWGTTTPTVVNAFYAPAKNQISFPAAILQMPFFHKDAPKYLNYGGIGTVIGHEITHGFDDNGRQYDKNGNRVPWWTSETIEKFNERKTCIANQYSSYAVAQINFTINGNQTQGENIADNGGLKEAFYAYRKWSGQYGKHEKKLPGLKKYTAEQMFFINYGQVWCSKMTDEHALSRILTGVHSPGQFRILGPTSNFDEFDRVFNCKPGQGNSQVNKCMVW